MNGAAVTIGVLALQGDFARHQAALRRASVSAAEVRKPPELSGVDGLIIPGGESTTLLTLMQEWDFFPALRAFHAAGKPIFGTCAGLILLAREVENPSQLSLSLLDVRVGRNAYGRQKESFETEVMADLGQGPRPIKAVLIRAPRIRRLGPGVTPLVERDGECLMARQGNVLVASFHPELTDDPAVHGYFLDMVRSSPA